jgi:predicted ATPase with chaperone activity
MSCNPCPCGYYGDKLRACTCFQSVITNYQQRISGPLLDRIDIHLHVPRVDYQKMSSQRSGKPSSQIRKRVQAARQEQLSRFSRANSAQLSDGNRHLVLFLIKPTVSSLNSSLFFVMLAISHSCSDRYSFCLLLRVHFFGITPQRSL